MGFPVMVMIGADKSDVLRIRNRVGVRGLGVGPVPGLIAVEFSGDAQFAAAEESGILLDSGSSGITPNRTLVSETGRTL